VWFTHHTLNLQGEHGEA